MNDSKSSDAPPLSETPHRACRATQEALLRIPGVEHVMMDCPGCAAFGTRCMVLSHPVAALEFARAFPLSLVQLRVPFPPVIMRKSRGPRGSMHGSTIVSGGDEDEKETMKIWFKQALADPKHFELPKPEADERQATASRKFSDYIEIIKTTLGAKVWDIQYTSGDTISIVLQDSEGLQKELSGRADYIISSPDAKVQGAAYQHALCVVEIQSKPNEKDCEYQLVTYLVLLMNRYGLNRVAGILVYDNGTCRAYRASRDGEGAVYEENDTFDLYQIADILRPLLDF